MYGSYNGGATFPASKRVPQNPNQNTSKVEQQHIQGSHGAESTSNLGAGTWWELGSVHNQALSASRSPVVTPRRPLSPRQQQQSGILSPRLADLHTSSLAHNIVKGQPTQYATGDTGAGAPKGMSVRDLQQYQEQQRLWNTAVERKASQWLESWTFQQKTEGMVEALDDLNRLLNLIVMEKRNKSAAQEAQLRMLVQRVESQQAALDISRKSKAELVETCKDLSKQLRATVDPLHELETIKRISLEAEAGRQALLREKERIDKEMALVAENAKRSREEVSRMQGRLAAMEKLQVTAGRSDELEERVREMQLVVRNKEDDILASYKRVHELEQRLKDESTKVAEMQKKLLEADGRVRAVEVEMQACRMEAHQTIRQREEEDAAAGRRAHEAHQAVSRVVEKHAKLRRKYDEMRTTHVMDMDKISRLEAEVQQLKRAAASAVTKADDQGYAKVAVLSKDVSDKDDLIKSLQQDLKRKDVDVANKDRLLKKLQDEAESAREERERHLRDWKDMSNELQTMRSRLVGMSSQGSSTLSSQGTTVGSLSDRQHLLDDRTASLISDGEAHMKNESERLQQQLQQAKQREQQDREQHYQHQQQQQQQQQQQHVSNTNMFGKQAEQRQMRLLGAAAEVRQGDAAAVPKLDLRGVVQGQQHRNLEAQVSARDQYQVASDRRPGASESEGQEGGGLPQRRAREDGAAVARASHAVPIAPQRSSRNDAQFSPRELFAPSRVNGVAHASPRDSVAAQPSPRDWGAVPMRSPRGGPVVIASGGMAGSMSNAHGVTDAGARGEPRQDASFVRTLSGGGGGNEASHVPKRFEYGSPMHSPRTIAPAQVAPSSMYASASSSPRQQQHQQYVYQQQPSSVAYDSSRHVVASPRGVPPHSPRNVDMNHGLAHEHPAAYPTSSSHPTSHAYPGGGQYPPQPTGLAHQQGASFMLSSPMASPRHHVAYAGASASQPVSQSNLREPRVVASTRVQAPAKEWNF